MARRLTDWLDSYLQYTQFSEAPDHFHLWAGVAAIAGALRRKVFIDQAYFRWSPNFYIIFVAPSGIATKSTAMNAAMDILKEVQSIHFGPNTMTWQALMPSLQQAQEQVLMPGGEYETQSCLTFASSEFGTLLDPSDRKMLDVLTDLWDGKSDAWKKATATMESYEIINPWLNIAACTTPSWLADNLPRHVIGAGFTSRCVFVYADKKKQLVAYPKLLAQRLKGMDWFRKLKEDLVHDMEEMSTLSGEYQLDQKALALGTAWYEGMYKTPARNLILNNFDGYLARKQGHVHKLAMILAASYKNELVINEDDLTKAIQWMNLIEDFMPKVFQHIKSDDNGAKIQDVIQVVAVHGKISRQSLYRIVFGKTHMQKKDFDEAINSAIEAGVVKQTGNGTGFILTMAETPTSTPDTSERNDLPAAGPVPGAADS